MYSDMDPCQAMEGDLGEPMRRTEVQYLRDDVRRALDEQPTLADFLRVVEERTGYPARLTGANPVLDRDSVNERDVRLNRLGLRRHFWLRLVTGWSTDFERMAETEGPAVLAHLWRGLVGKRLTSGQRVCVRRLAARTGVVEAGRAMCTAVGGSPESTPPDALFQDFSNRCCALIVERERQGLPVLKLKWRPTGGRARSPHSDDLDGDGWDWDELRAELKGPFTDMERRMGVTRETGEDNLDDVGDHPARGAA